LFDSHADEQRGMMDQFNPSEGINLVYSRLTLPSYLDDGKKTSEEIIDAYVKFELGLTSELKVYVQLDREREGVLGFDRELLQLKVKDQMGVNMPDDLFYFSIGKLNVSLTQKVLAFCHGETPSVSGDELSLSFPSLEISKSTSDEYTCSICLCILINPASLPCGHTLCKECIQPIMRTKNYRQRICPMCRTFIPSDYPLTINTDIQARVEKIFALDEEYRERKWEVWDEEARRQGITLYRLPPLPPSATATAATNTDNDDDVVCSTAVMEQARKTRLLAAVKLKQRLLSLSTLPPPLPPLSATTATATTTSYGGGGGGASRSRERFRRFYQSVSVSDFDSVQRGGCEGQSKTKKSGVSKGGEGTEVSSNKLEAIAEQLHHMTQLTTPPLAATASSHCCPDPLPLLAGPLVAARIKNIFFPRLLSSIDMTGDSSFFDMCEMFLKSFLA
jgi:hypothetical protein